MIVKSLSKFCVLFPFLDLQKLSDDRLSELCEMYSKSKENARHYFDYLKCNLDLINAMNNRKKNLQEMNDELQNQLSQLQKEFFEFRNKGQIIASIENGFIINAEINLMLNSSALDTSKSKVIISTSDAKCLGSEAYEKGEPITSHHMKKSFIRNHGTYYVRCIVFNNEGESNEIVSNSVTTSENCLTFGYEGEPEKLNVHINVLKVENLMNIDSNCTGFFVKVSVGDEEATKKVKKMSTSIQWNQEFDFVSRDFISDKLVLQLYSKGGKSNVNKRMIDDLTFPLIKFQNIEYNTPTIYKVPMKMREQEIGQISFEFSSAMQKEISAHKQFFLDFTVVEVDFQNYKKEDILIPYSLKSCEEEPPNYAPINEKVSCIISNNESLVLGFWDQETEDDLCESVQIDLSKFYINGESTYSTDVYLDGEKTGFIKVVMHIFDEDHYNKEKTKKT